MDTFVISAPGKVILHGEHAVVYGKTAIAASISLRTYLLVTKLYQQVRVIHLRFPDIGLDRKWLIDDLPWDCFQDSGCFTSIKPPEPRHIEALNPHLEFPPHETPDRLQKAQHAATSAFLYLYLAMFNADSACSFSYTLRSEIPVGAGLGSSSSMAVCISTALLLQTNRITSPRLSKRLKDPQAIAQVNESGFIAETFIHGNPSGIDNTISTRGGAIRFRRNFQTEVGSIELLDKFPKIEFLLTNTRQSRSTSVEVEKVREFRAKHPPIVDNILEAIEKVTESATFLFRRAETGANSRETREQLGDLLRINHSLLASLGVSHPALERVRYLIDHRGVGWTKLTGAGGGGCAISILKSGLTERRLEILGAQIEAEGFEQYKVLTGGHGIGILCPTDQSFDIDTSIRTQERKFTKMFTDAAKRGLGKTIEDYAGSQGVRWQFWSS